MSVLVETDLPYPLYRRGKVRDSYELSDGLLLMIATDRISAFDFVLPGGIPQKGKVLNLLSAFWFDNTAHLVPNHVVRVLEDLSALDSCFPVEGSCPSYVAGRSMIVKKAQGVPVECVVRGYLSGSAWEEYRQSGAAFGEALPSGLEEGQELPHPLFTPTTKAESGHDQNLTLLEVKGLVGRELAEEIREKSLAIYRYAQGYARTRGVIIADTKMEFGLIDGELCLIDELLTPDSSRFWDADSYGAGRSQPSFDKQPVRDWLLQSGWNKEPPAPMLPPEVIEQTTERYREAYRRLTGRILSD